MPLLSVVIITFNEEKNIARCLSSVKGVADEIVVVDSFSTDRTEEICRSNGAKFIQRKWEGYSSTKNFANTQAAYDLVLSLDADEALSEELRQSIVKIKSLPHAGTYSFNRLTNYCGKWIKHCGWYPDVKTRIFDRHSSAWQGDIHELLQTKTPPIHLSGDCLHYSYYTVEEHYRQADKFASLSAKNMFMRNKRTSALGVYFRCIAKFIRNYFIKLGFLDGPKGFTVCRITAYETYLKYSRLLQMQKSVQNDTR
jgi:glycosyltransferase involved in cell wall biosynthesis